MKKREFYSKDTMGIVGDDSPSKKSSKKSDKLAEFAATGGNQKSSMPEKGAKLGKKLKNRVVEADDTTGDSPNARSRSLKASGADGVARKSSQHILKKARSSVAGAGKGVG